MAENYYMTNIFDFPITKSRYLDAANPWIWD